MELDQLAERNRALAARRHQFTWRQRLRRALLRVAARQPARPIRAPREGVILLIRPDHVGDIILTLPAIQALKRHAPESQIIALAGPWGAETLAACPELDMVLTLPFPGFARSPEGGRPRGLLSLLHPYRMALRWAHQLREVRPETAVILRPDHWWGAMLAHRAGIVRRIGYDLPDVRPFLTEALPFQERHTTLQALGLVEHWVGRVDPATVRLTFPITEEDRADADAMLATHSIGTGRASGRFLVIHPGAGSAIKRWPPEHWATVADRLADRLDAAVVFTGSDREHLEIWQIIDLMRRSTHPAVSLAGETNIAQLAALYERALLVLGPDTGPLHLAAASGAPTVHLFGPADPALFGPWGDPVRHEVVAGAIGCRPCRVLDWATDELDHHPCIRMIMPAQVISAAMRVVGTR